MTNSKRFTSNLCIGAGLLALSACGTQEVGPNPGLVVGDMATPDSSQLLLAFASTAESYEELQASAAANPDLTPYSLFLDGRQLIRDLGDQYGGKQPIIAREGATFGFGYIPSGPHHFTLEAPGGGRPLFAGDAEIASGSTTILYLVGRLDALKGHFVSLPEPAAGTLHVDVISLVRGGAQIEVVSCGDADGCTPLSPALSLGETFAADYPAVDGDTGPALADGRQIGFRLAPTAELPAPPVQQITSARTRPAPTNVAPMPPVNYAVAPLYFYPQGHVFTYFLN
jgi:hypothetical protein